jgi:hypothetical protein
MFKIRPTLSNVNQECSDEANRFHPTVLDVGATCSLRLNRQNGAGISLILAGKIGWRLGVWDWDPLAEKR